MSNDKINLAREALCRMLDANPSLDEVRGLLGRPVFETERSPELNMQLEMAARSLPGVGNVVLWRSLTVYKSGHEGYYFAFFSNVDRSISTAIFDGNDLNTYLSQK